jgi:hypothetical protein
MIQKTEKNPLKILALVKLRVLRFNHKRILKSQVGEISFQLLFSSTTKQPQKYNEEGTHTHYA